MNNIIISQSREETLKAGRELASSLKGGEVIALYGSLGAGKTVFVKGVIGFFLQGKRVLSPTFIIVRHYSLHQKTIKEIVHADIYRLNDLKQIEDVGLSEFFNKPGIIVLIEWAEKMKGLLPEKRIDVHFRVLSDVKRKILFKTNG